MEVYRKARIILEALGGMRDGATVEELVDRIALTTPESISYSCVRTHLLGLRTLGLVDRFATHSGHALCFRFKIASPKRFRDDENGRR